MSAAVFVTVGTDHHTFDRLMTWVEDWLAARPEVRCVVQHGASRQPAGAQCHQLLPHDQMRGMFETSAAVVCQGGPGGIAECLDAGRRPIVVPRIARLGEVVDDHQVAFARRLADLGKVALAETPQRLGEHLNAALADPAGYAVTPGPDSTAGTADRFGALVEEMLSRSAGPPRSGRRAGFWSRMAKHRSSPD